MSSPNWSNPGGSWQFIRRITPQRDEVGYLFRIDAISLPNVFRPNTRQLAAPRRVEDRCALRGELKGISIATRHHRGAAGAFLSSNRSGEKVIRLEPWSFGVCKPAGGDKFRQRSQLLDQILGELSPALIGRDISWRFVGVSKVSQPTMTARGRSSM